MKTMQEKAPLNIKGIRTCRRCLGICHEESWRKRAGKRRAYWCSEECLREDIGYVEEKDWLWYRDLGYELVNVITD